MMTTTITNQAHQPTSLSSYTTTEITVTVGLSVVSATILLVLSAAHFVLCTVFYTGCTITRNDIDRNISAYNSTACITFSAPPPPSPGSPTQDPSPAQDPLPPERQ
jgi:hypothetical protein